MTNQDIFRIAMLQSALESNCSVDDFLLSENKTVLSKENPKARKYLHLPFYCDLAHLTKKR